ncbi:MAG: hypothetical protein HC925_00250 [Coleofasciculaceae cyanobacterium SM2_3_26]|nr:hypothetical protein [Coleofasciculaceae cyanobacterium SM2_3_26]
MRQPLELDIFGASRRSLLLLGAAILIFAGILYQRSQIGLLAPEVIGGTLPLLGKFVLLPGVIFLFVVRQSWFQALER